MTVEDTRGEELRINREAAVQDASQATDLSTISVSDITSEAQMDSTNFHIFIDSIAQSEPRILPFHVIVVVKLAVPIV